MGPPSFPRLRVQSSLSMAQEPIEIETNPFFHASTGLKMLGERDDDILHQLEFT